MEWLKQAPTIIVLVTLYAAGLIAVWGLFDQKLKARNKEKDELEDRVVALYRTETDALNKKLTTQGEQIQSMQTELARIGGENRLMRDLLTGQDKDTKAWRSRTEKSMDLIEKVTELVMENGKKSDAAIEGIKQVGKHVERLALAIEKSGQARG